MRMEAMVMTEMAMMMPVMMVMAEIVAAHPGIGVEHARIDVDDAERGTYAARPGPWAIAGTTTSTEAASSAAAIVFSIVVSLRRSRGSRSDGRFVDHALEPNGRALNLI